MPVVTYLDSILGPMGAYEEPRSVHDNNYVDRLSHHYTIIYLLFASITVVTEEYVGQPIYCWCPSYFSDQEVDFANYVCWVSNTYYIPHSEVIPPQYEMRATTEITYYQWVPLMFLMLAFFFRLPRIVWKYLVNRSGVTIKSILEQVFTAQNSYDEDRSKIFKYLALYIGNFSSLRRGPRAGVAHNLRESLSYRCFLGCGRNYGNYLVTVAIFVKFLFFVNCAGQLFLINEFLGNRFYVFGYEAFEAYFSGRTLELTPRFPRVTLCDYDFRQMSNVQRFTLQCVLPINYYNEAFFVILWFWLTVMTVLTFLNFCLSTISILLPVNKQSFMKKYLVNIEKSMGKRSFTKLLHKFMDQYLRQDGVFILKMISNHSNTTILGEIVQHLWKDFMSRLRVRAPKHRSRGRMRHISRYHPINFDQDTAVPLLVKNGILTSIERRLTHRDNSLDDIQEVV